MISRATPDFWACYAQLPAHVRKAAKAAYQLWKADPHHPGLRFKPVAAAGEDVWSVRIGIRWRALGVRDQDTIIWFWIGSHADYDRLVGRS